jgi:hypothetical protein
MSDPFGERLRSYYQSMQSDAPARLEAKVARDFDSRVKPARAGAAWRPAAGLLAAGAAVLVAALVFRGLAPGPTPTPTGSPPPSPTVSSTTTAPPSDVPVVTPMPESVQFSPTGSMILGRDGATATLLKTGQVLVVGGKVATGSVTNKTNTAELYNPATGKFTATGSLADARWGHTATLLNDGRVLVVGGADLSDGAGNLKTAELYNPTTGAFTATGSMATGRASHTATLLNDGRVLIAGGTNSIGLASAEIYDPATGKFKVTGSMTVARQDHAAARLADGRVLVVGGTANGVVGPFGVLSSAEIYDPATGKFTATGSMSTPRQGPTATLMFENTVMVTGGRDQNSTFLGSAEVYDPSVGQFVGMGGWVPDNARARSALLLGDGPSSWLLTIGWNAPGATAAYYDGGHFGFYTAGSTTADIACQTATLLPDGRVLLLGGLAANGRPSATATVYTLANQA